MSNLKISKAPNGELEKEILKLNFTKGAVLAQLSIISFIDKDTKQYMLYAPSIEVSAYGDTPGQANEMFNQAIKGVFDYFLSLNRTGVDRELSRLGWKHNPFFKKEYSKIFVDVNGVLQGLNAEENSIERLTLISA